MNTRGPKKLEKGELKELIIFSQSHGSMLSYP